jgi:hypothetical protein
MSKEYKLSLTAEQIDEALQKALLVDNSKIEAISITEAADGVVTMVNTLDEGTETIVVSADANGNPNKLTYNGKEIPIEWVVSE